MGKLRLNLWHQNLPVIDEPEQEMTLFSVVGKEKKMLRQSRMIEN